MPEESDSMVEVLWPEETSLYKGRNGICKCSGLYTYLYRGRTRITALNSRGEGIACWIEIPEDQCLNVCLAILPELSDLLRSVPKEKLPALIGTSLEPLIEKRVRGE